MAKVIIGHHPELTAEGAMKVFKSHFHDKYNVYKTKMPAYDFVVKKSAWSGVGVKLRQKRGQTHFELRGMPPGTAVFALWFVLWGVWVFLGLQALVRAGAWVGPLIGFLLWFALGLWLLSLAFSRPSRKIENEVKALIEKTVEFKQPAAAHDGASDTEGGRKSKQIKG